MSRVISDQMVGCKEREIERMIENIIFGGECRNRGRDSELLFIPCLSTVNNYLKSLQIEEVEYSRRICCNNNFVVDRTSGQRTTGEE